MAARRSDGRVNYQLPCGQCEGMRESDRERMGERGFPHYCSI